MSSTLPCPECSALFSIEDSQFGTYVLCPTCGASVTARRPPPPKTQNSPPPPPVRNEEPERVLPAPSPSHPESFFGGFSKLRVDDLLPLGILSPAELFSKEVRWVLTFGLFPLAILYLVAILNLTFSQSAWLIGGYFCYFWAIYFNGQMRPSRALSNTGIAYCFFTAFVGIPILFFWQTLPIISALYTGTDSQHFVPRLLGYVLGVGILEEICKALPLVLFAWRRGVLSARDGIYLGIMSGLGFALAEVVQYSINYWQQAAHLSAMLISTAVEESKNWIGGLDQDQFASKLQQIVPWLGEQYGNQVLIQIVRFIPLPLLHAAWAGTVGYFIASASQKPETRWQTVTVGIAFVAILHGLYDVFAGSVIGFLLAALSILIFMGYLISTGRRNS